MRQETLLFFRLFDFKIHLKLIKYPMNVTDRPTDQPTEQSEYSGNLDMYMYSNVYGIRCVCASSSHT